MHDCVFTQETESAVKVTGTRFKPSDGFFLKLEGTKKIGYRTVSIAACRDPIMIAKIDDIIEGVKARVTTNFKNFGITEFFLDFKLYGKNGVMGMFKNISTEPGSELGIVIEAVAQTQEIANTICSFARSSMLHYGYEGRISTAGNLAFPFSPSDFKVGEVYEFSIYHLMKVDDPADLFPITYVTIVNGKEQT